MDKNDERRLQSAIVVITSAGMVVLAVVWWLVEGRLMWPALVGAAAMPVLLFAIRRLDVSLAARRGTGLSAPEGRPASAFEKAVAVFFVAALAIAFVWMMLHTR